MNKVFTWVNSDLDGVGCTILLGNIFSNFSYRGIFFGDFENQFEEWWKDNHMEYDKIFVVGFPLSQELINKLDDEQIIFVHDFPESFKSYDSKIIQENTTSCSKLLYKTFKEKFEFPKNIKRLISIIDDYNSQKLKFRESFCLNAIFRKTFNGRFKKLVKKYWYGFVGFSDRELNLIKEFVSDLKRELKNLELYTGQYEQYSVISTFSKFPVNELAVELLKRHDKDVVIVVNPDTNFVSFRKNKNSDLDLKKMAEFLCEGGGNEYAAGGKITKNFLKFTEELEKI